MKLDETKGSLYVRMLDGFSMVYDGRELVDGRQIGSQFCGLMEAVLYSGKAGMNRTQLKEILFEDREIEDVQHAIRNVIYNAKKRLKAAGLPDDGYIDVVKGTYYWVSQVPLVLDTEEMMKLKEEADHEADRTKKLELLTEAAHLYRSSFLEHINNSTWAMQEARKYRMLFHETVNEAAEIIRESKDFRALKALGDYAVSVDPFADWEVLVVEALASMGKYEEAQNLCEDTIDLYVMEFGQRTSTYVRELANRLSASLIHQHDNLDDIQDKLTETVPDKRGGYYCSYPVFQEVYRILSRTMDRQEDRIFIMLCTVMDSKGNPMKEGPKLEELSDRLQGAIVHSVRHSDTVAKYGKGQYLVLLVNTTRDNCSIVQKRIDKNFLLGRQRTGIDYAVKSVIISPLALEAQLQ